MSSHHYLATTLLTVSLLIAGCGKVDDGFIQITTSSSRARDLFVEGRDYFELHKIEQAIERFQQAVEIDPDFAQAHAYLGALLPDAGERHRHLTAARAQIEELPEPERLVVLSFEARFQRNAAREGEYLRFLVTARPEDPRAQTYLGFFHFHQQKYPEAVKKFIRAIELDPQYAPPRNVLGYCYRAVGNFAEAEKSFRRYIELLPEEPNPHDSYAELLLKMGRHEESIASYRRAIELDSSFLYSYEGIAANLICLDRHEDARAELAVMRDRAATPDGQRRARLATAVTFADEQRFDEAIQALEENLTKTEEPRDAMAIVRTLNTIGILLIAAEKPDEAAERFEAALAGARESDLPPSAEQDAGLANVANELRLALYRGDLMTAKARADTFSARVRPTGDVGLIRESFGLTGRVAYAGKDFAQAVSFLKMAGTEDPEILYLLARAHQEMGDAASAREFARKAAEFNGISNLKYALVRRMARQLLKETPEA